MSAFLEEYGKVIVVIIVIGALIILASIFNSAGKDSAQKSFKLFTGTAEDSAQTASDQASNALHGNTNNNQ